MAVRIFYIPVGDFGPSMLSLVTDSFASSKRETTPGPWTIYECALTNYAIETLDII